jgi:hypothetical protein
VLQSRLQKEQMEMPVTFSSGTYVAVITDNGRPLYRKKFSVIH